MSWEKHFLQTATVWSATPNAFGGSSFTSPRTIECRWEDKQIEFVSNMGRTEVSRAVVYVLEDLYVGDYIYLGESSAADPSIVPGAHPIKSFAKYPDLRSMKTLRKAVL